MIAWMTMRAALFYAHYQSVFTCSIGPNRLGRPRESLPQRISSEPPTGTSLKLVSMHSSFIITLVRSAGQARPSTPTPYRLGSDSATAVV